eukprot:15430409-Alexandrium_andersonii.AAC.1
MTLKEVAKAKDQSIRETKRQLKAKVVEYAIQERLPCDWVARSQRLSCTFGAAVPAIACCDWAVAAITIGLRLLAPELP